MIYIKAILLEKDITLDEIRKNEIKKLELKYENEDILMKKYIF